MWGCRPSAGVLANTEMVRDLIQVLETNYDKDRMRMVLPVGLEHMKGKDANFETVTSNTIQPVQLNFYDKVITDSIAYIFVNTDCNGLAYKQAEIKGEKLEELYTTVLEFKEVKMF